MTTKVKSNPKKDFLIENLHIFILFAFAVAQPLYDLLSQYADFFVVRRSKPIDIILFTLIISIFIPLLLVLIEMGLKLITSNTIHKIVHIGLVGILIVTIVFPILKKIEFFHELLIWIIALLLGGIFIFGYIRLKHLRMYITFLLPSILIFPILFLFFSPVSKIAFPQKHVILQTEQKSEIKDHPPIVMVVFDEIATPYLMNEDKQIDSIRYPNFASLANQAYWFRYTTTVVHATTWATPVILSGLYPSLENPKLPSIVGYPNNLFTFLCNTYQLNVIESATEMCPKELNNIHLSSKNWIRRLVSLLSDSSIIYLHYLLPQSLTHSLPDISQNWGQFYKKKAGFSKNIKKKEKILKGRSKLYKQFIDSISPTTVPALFFLHILLPHPPVKYLPSGKTYGDYGYIGIQRERWGWNEWAVTSGFQRFLLQLQYVDTLLGELLAKLKATELYDESLIVITADHGASYRLGGYRRNVTEKNAGDIMPVPLFIKLPNQKEGVIDDENVETVDILPTIASAAGIQLPLPVDGHSVFAKSFPKRPNKIILGEKKYVFSNTRFSEIFSESLSHMLTLFGAGKTRPDGLFRIGPFKSIIGKSVSQFRTSDKKSIKIDMTKILPFFERIELSSGFLPCFINGNIFTDIPLDLAISVNGTIYGVSKTVRIKKNLSIFFTMVPEHAFKAGKNDIDIFVIRAGTDGMIELEQTIKK